MILPLHHCCALGCMELIDPGEIMCIDHWAMVSLPTVRMLVAAPRGSSRWEHAEMHARIEVAQIEGRNPICSAYSLLTDASQSFTKKQNLPCAVAVSGDAESLKETTT